MKRPAIPSELKRTIMVEAGHRCAIPTCRHITVDIHHIIPWEKCEKHEYPNLIALCPNCHRRADKGEIDRKALKMYKNNLKYIYDKYTTFEIDLLYELNKLPERKGILIPTHFKLLVKRLIDSKLIIWNEQKATILVGGLKSNPDLVGISPEGRKYIKQINNEEIGY